MRRLAAVVVATLVVGAGEAYAEEPPKWLLLRVDKVQATPERPGGGRWDGKAPEDNSDGLCTIVGGVTTVATSGLGGSLAGALCGALTQEGQVERDPQAPDLRVQIAGGGVTYRSPIAQDSYYHRFGYAFVIPVDAVPATGLHVEVYDVDGDPANDGELLGSVRLTRKALLGALSSDPILLLADGGVQQLELVVERYGRSHTLEATVPADSTTQIGQGEVRAGEVVELRATGDYSVADNKRLLGPDGYPDGKKRGYNLDAPPFNTANHGAAIALIGTDATAFEGYVIGHCVTVTAPFSGALLAGVNDEAPKNNRGSYRLTVRIRPASASEWRSAGARPCAETPSPAAPESSTSPPSSSPPPKPAFEGNYRVTWAAKSKNRCRAASPKGMTITLRSRDGGAMAGVRVFNVPVTLTGSVPAGGSVDLRGERDAVVPGLGHVQLQVRLVATLKGDELAGELKIKTDKCGTVFQIRANAR